MSRFVNPWEQFIAKDGQPYDGGSVYFGVANKDPVENPKAPFSDKPRQVPIGARQILNDAGDFDTEIFLSGFYSLSLFDKEDNFIRTAPEIEGSTLDSGFYVEDYDTFALAVAAAAGSQLFISSNIVVDANITVSGLTLLFIQGGQLAPSVGVTVTLNCTVLAGNYEIFDSTAAGLIRGDFQGNPLNPFWFGAKGDFSVQADDLAAFDLVATVANGGPRAIHWPKPPGGFYPLSDTWVTTSGELIFSSVGPSGMLGSTNEAGAAVMQISGDHNVLKNFGWTGRVGGGDGLIVGNESGSLASNGNTFENLLSQWVDDTGFRVERGQSNTWDNCRHDINTGYDLADYASHGLTRGSPRGGLTIEPSTANLNNDNRFTNCQLNGGGEKGDDTSFLLKVGSAAQKVFSFSWISGLIQGAANYQLAFLSVQDANIESTHMEPPVHEVFPTQGAPYNTFTTATGGNVGGTTIEDTGAFTAGQFDDNADSGQAIFRVKMGAWSGATGETAEVESNTDGIITLKTALSVQVQSGDQYQVINVDSENNYRMELENCKRLVVDDGSIQGDILITGTSTDTVELNSITGTGIDIARESKRVTIDGFDHTNISIGPASGKIIDRAKDTTFKRMSNANNERATYGLNLNYRSTPYFHTDFSTWNGGAAKTGIAGVGILGATTNTGFFTMSGISSGTAGDTVTLNDSTNDWVPNTLVGQQIEITAGTNSGDKRIISAISATSITVSLAFSGTIDATSEYDISANYVMDSSPAPTTTVLAVDGGSWVTDTLIDRKVRVLSGVNNNIERLIVSNTASTITVSPAFSSASSGGDLFVVEDMAWVKSGAYAFKMDLPTLLTSGIFINIPVLNSGTNNAQIHFKIKAAQIGSTGTFIVKGDYNGGAATASLTYEQLVDATTVPTFQTMQGTFNIIEGTTSFKLTLETSQTGNQMVVDEMEIWVDDYRITDWLSGVANTATPNIDVVGSGTGPQAKFISLDGTTTVTSFNGAIPGIPFTIIGTGAKSVQDQSVSGDIHTKTGAATSINNITMHLIKNIDDGEFYEI